MVTIGVNRAVGKRISTAGTAVRSPRVGAGLLLALASCLAFVSCSTDNPEVVASAPSKTHPSAETVVSQPPTRPVANLPAAGVNDYRIQPQDTLQIAAAFNASYLLYANDDKIKTYEDVEALGLSLLTGLPHIGLKDPSQAGRVLQADPHSISAEAFRGLRATITLNPEVNAAKPLLVTSTAPGEGKSVVSANLAIAFATNRQRTLLIDCDLHHPAQQRVFPGDADRGISLYLTDSSSLRDVVQPTDIPNLDVLHTGKVLPSASELLGTEKVGQLIAEACRQYDRVIIDSPPVTAVSDPLLLLPHVRGVVYVIGFDRIRREIVSRSMQKLRDCGAPLVGAVMNDIALQLHGHYYYPCKYSYYHKKRIGNGAG